jgi:hypothetical protein
MRSGHGAATLDPPQMTLSGSRRSKLSALRDASLLDHLVGGGNSVSGMVRPSALAVLRLTIISNLVGCCTGTSAGFSA